MPPGSKKRKAAKKKQQQQQTSSPQTNPKPNNQKSREEEEDAVRIQKDTDERIEIITDKNSSRSSSSSSSISSDDESSEVKNKETVESVSSVPNQPITIAGDAPFMGSTANVIVESTGLMDSATPSDPNTEKTIETAPVESSLPKPNVTTAEVSLASDEVKHASSSSATVSGKKENEGETSTLSESNSVTEATTISREEEAPMRPTHGVAERTSWLSCCGLFDVVTGPGR